MVPEGPAEEQPKGHTGRADRRLRWAQDPSDQAQRREVLKLSKARGSDEFKIQQDNRRWPKRHKSPNLETDLRRHETSENTLQGVSGRRAVVLSTPSRGHCPQFTCKSGVTPLKAEKCFLHRTGPDSALSMRKSINKNNKKNVKGKRKIGFTRR